MRALMAIAMAAGLAGLGLMVVLAGKVVAPDKGALSGASSIEADAESLPSAVPEPSEATLPGPNHPARGVGEDLIARPDLQSEELLREKPREPMSSLSQALPPPEPEITLFYRPVATASASFESMGYKLAIAGTESVDPDETCTSGSIDWPCGIRARTAVRMWLRGRALNCKPPLKDKDKLATVACSLGKQDVGAWLVSNGWARAALGGPYVEAEVKARKARMGIFGPPPKTAD